MYVREMAYPECHSLVAAGDLARLACCKEGQPYIVPITYVLDGQCLYCFSMPGQKVDWMRANSKVCLQVDAFSGRRQWKSVILTGRYRELSPAPTPHSEWIRAWSLLEKKTNWWEPGGLKPGPQLISGESPHIFFSVDVDGMTGRAAFEDEP
ncbi:MAG TPA: pyridoxamine 5'-phosphate oxidase family protein [Mycoplana sp.]|nr:pyridoxamine 5'-phosphate oxidase family protein [Mycoplana sp.]